jgi:hypothetical protein
MRMRFDVDTPGDEDAAHAAREHLVAQFGQWVGTRDEYEAADPSDVDLLLSWKWGYGDGDFGRWARADVDEVLLDHLPGKLSASTDAAASIPLSLAAWVHFLDDNRLLDAASEPADVLASRALAQQRAFLDAMADPANVGMAKGLLGALGVGDDLSDQAALDAAISRFNDLPFDERGEILGLDTPGVGDPDDLELPPLPFRAMPSPASVDAPTGDVPLLRKVDALVNALDAAGAKLTRAGNLALADGRRLVAATGVGDRVEGVRSTTELRELFAVAQVAQLAGATEVVGNMLRPVGAWADEPTGARWRRVVDAVLEAGAATLAFGAHVPLQAQLAELADQMAYHLLAILWGADEPIPVEMFVDMMDEAAHITAPLGADGLDGVRAVCRNRLHDVVTTLGEAGVVATSGAGGVAFTEAGPLLVGPILREVGFGILFPGDLAGLDAAGLIDALTEREGDDLAAAAQAWASGRAAGDVPRELVAELVRRPEPARVMVGFSVLEHLGAEATDAVRGLTDGPLAGHAWLFLADRGAADGDVPLDVIARTGVDLFLGVADLGSPADVVEMVLGNIPAGEHTAFVDSLAGADHPRTSELLELLGRHHPDGATAKYARKAAHRRRSSHTPG